MGGGDQVAVLHLEVVDWGDGQVELHPGPASSVVDRGVHARLGARVQEPGLIRVLPEDACEVVVRNAADDGGPRRSVVVRPEEKGAVVVELVPGGREVGGGRVVAGRLDEADHRPLRQAVGGDVAPRAAAVPRHVDEAIVGPSPEEAGLQGRLGEGVYGAVDLRPRALGRDGAGQLLL